jgi:hypothetical protein
MRLENWNPNAFDETFDDVAKERLEEAAELIAGATRQNLRSLIGAGKTTGISRPVYRKGPYAGQPWTAREFGQLLKSVRVTKKQDKWGHEMWRRKNIRVYCGNYLAYYARIFEFSKPFMRPAFYGKLSEVKTIIGATTEQRGSWGDVLFWKPAA